MALLGLLQPGPWPPRHTPRPLATSLNKISWPDLKFNQRVRLKHTEASYLELADTMALTANNAVAFLPGETSERSTFLAFQGFFLKIIFENNLNELTCHCPTLGTSSPPLARLRLPHQAREQQSAQGLAGQRGSRWRVGSVFAFMGYAGQPACSSCFILSAAENQITWNKALTASHRGTSERTWPQGRSTCCWGGRRPSSAWGWGPNAPPAVTVPGTASKGTF